MIEKSTQRPSVWLTSTQTPGPMSAFSCRLVQEDCVTPHLSRRLVCRLDSVFCWYRHLSIPQRQMLRAVPVSEIHYEWKDCNSRFWVYGHDKKVHAPDYPQKCCCGCVIIWELHARPLITTAVDVDEIGGFQHLVCISVAVLGRKKYVLTIALSNYWRRIT